MNMNWPNNAHTVVCMQCEYVLNVKYKSIHEPEIIKNSVFTENAIK